MIINNDSITHANVIQGGMVAVLSDYYIDAIERLWPWLIVALVLNVADLKFGISAACYRGEKIKASHALRRTMDKFISYICWIMVAVSLSKAFGCRWLEMVIMGLAVINEIISCVENWYEVKGKRVKIDISRILKSQGTDIDAITIRENKKKNKRGGVK